MKKLFSLFVSFFQIGLFTIGGGYAMLPMLQREVVERHGWVTEEEVLDCYAIGQCTPGVIAVNTATFVGARQAGIPGAIAATCGIVAPSLLIISLLAGIIRRFSHLSAVQHAFAGIRVAVCVLILQAQSRMWRKGVRDRFGFAVFAVALVLSVVLKVSTVWIVLGALAFGLVLAWKEGRRK